MSHSHWERGWGSSPSSGTPRSRRAAHPFPPAPGSSRPAPAKDSSLPGILPKSPPPRPPGSQPQRHRRLPVVPSCAVHTLRTGPVQPPSVCMNSRAGRDLFLTPPNASLLSVPGASGSPRGPRDYEKQKSSLLFPCCEQHGWEASPRTSEATAQLCARAPG